MLSWGESKERPEGQLEGERDNEVDSDEDDGWVQRDEQKEQIKRRLKRTGYGRWRKSLDAATRYELERENASRVVTIEVDDDYYSSFRNRSREQAGSASTTSSLSSSCRSSFSATSSSSQISSRESSLNVLPSPSSAPSVTSSSTSSSLSSSPSASSLSSSKSTAWAVGGRSSSVRAQRRSIGVTRGHELERALEREALAATTESRDETQRQRTTEAERSEQVMKGSSGEETKKDKKTTGKKAEKRNKGGSKLLFWKKGKGETSKRDLHVADVMVDSTANARSSEEDEEGATNTESAITERERSGTMDFYAIMGSGYHKQHSTGQT